MLNRRAFIASTLCMLTPARHAIAGTHKATPLRFGAALPFSFDELVTRARGISLEPYRPPATEDLAQHIGYEQHGKIKFRSDCALQSAARDGYPATFFFLGRYFQQPIRLFAVERDTAAEVLYSPEYFDMPADSPARAPGFNGGFAGFRLQESRAADNWPAQDWLAYLGASYFRAIGSLGQYGISARGIAVNTTASTPEEFPRFSEFYLALTGEASQPITIYALLDGPSVCGAYAFKCHRARGVTMDVDARIFPRRSVEQLGIAPLTSMFWYSEYGKQRDFDWRPEVHDSDGLAVWTDTGERIWRPLNNPVATRTSSFVGTNPRGFGLLQRDRNPENYLDGVNYHARPSVWVEPTGRWGRGAVTLVEIPTNDEIHDNIVAFWRPAEPVGAGQSLQFRYRLYWQEAPPEEARHGARVVATRIGRGGEPGKPRPDGVTKFIVEFTRADAMDIAQNGQPVAEVTASRGTVHNTFAERVPHTQRWRAHFDLESDGPDPVELRLFLRAEDRALSETWLYQYVPIAHS